MNREASQTPSQHEAYAYGVIAPSLLIELNGRFPDEAGYGEIAEMHQSFGGEAAGSAFVLARLGVTTKLCGNRLGADSDSARVIELLTEAGVDCSDVSTDSLDPVTEVVVSSQGERTIFGSYGRMLAAQDWSQPSQGDVVSSSIVCLDPFFGDASERVARWCHEASIPYVTVDAPPDATLTRHAEVAIISEEFASRSLEATDARDVLAAYTRQCDGLVIVTLGKNGGLFARNSESAQIFTPFPVNARDTAGAGDSFRAGIIYGILQGHDDAALIEIASAVSAIVCQRAPGVLNSPSERELHQFLADIS